MTKNGEQMIDHEEVLAFYDGLPTEFPDLPEEDGEDGEKTDPTYRERSKQRAGMIRSLLADGKPRSYSEIARTLRLLYGEVYAAVRRSALWGDPRIISRK